MSSALSQPAAYLLAAVSIIPLRPGVAPPGGGAAACLEPVIAQINRAATREDSLTLAGRFEKSPPGGDKRCGQLIAGYLRGMTSTPAEDEWQNRRAAMGQLEEALRDFEDEPRLHLAMGVLLYNRQARTDALRSFGRALDRKMSGEMPLTPRELAIVYYYEGLTHQDYWRDWRSFGQLNSTAKGQWFCGRFETGDRDNFSSDSDDASWLIPINQVCATKFDQNMETYFEPRSNLKRSEYDKLVESFSAAIDVDPGFFPAYQALLGEFIYLEEWERADKIARKLVDHFPDDFRPYTYLGVVYHETGHDSLANVEFGKAFTRMPDSVLAIYESLDDLLLPRQREWLEKQNDQTKAVFKYAYWVALDPMFVTKENERKIEHYCRVTAAELMFSSPALKEHGWTSFAGKIWIRYGRPLNMRELRVPAGRAVFWNYQWGETHQPDVSFIRGSAYRSYRATDEALELSNRLGRGLPQANNRVVGIDTVADLATQVVRILDDDLKPQLLIYSEWPANANDSSIAGIFLLNPRYEPVAQWKGRKPREDGLTIQLGPLTPGRQYQMAVEVLDTYHRQLSRVRDTVTTLNLKPGQLAMSDVLLASHVAAALDDREPRNRGELTIEPLYGSVMKRGTQLGLFWEIYGLRRDRNGRAEYEVEIELRNAEKKRILARLLARITGEGGKKSQSTIKYKNNRPVVNGRVIEWVELAGELDSGAYTVRVLVKDRKGGGKVGRERTVIVE